MDLNPDFDAERFVADFPMQVETERTALRTALQDALAFGCG